MACRAVPLVQYELLTPDIDVMQTLDFLDLRKCLCLSTIYDSSQLKNFSFFISIKLVLCA